MIGTNSLNIRFYGGSKSNDYRVSAGVAQVNECKSRHKMLIQCFQRQGEMWVLRKLRLRVIFGSAINEVLTHV